MMLFNSFIEYHHGGLACQRNAVMFVGKGTEHLVGKDIGAGKKQAWRYGLRQP
jgi:hypothetical protein